MLLSVSDDNQLYITNDSGSTWKPLRTKPFKVGDIYPDGSRCDVEEFRFQDFIIMPFDSNIVYARGIVALSCPPRGEETSEFFLTRSRNGGFDWDFIRNGYYRFHFDPMFPDRAFIYGGIDWNPRLFLVTQKGIAPLSNTQIDLITEISKEPNRLLSYGQNGFMRSDDGGINWFHIPLESLQQTVTVLQSGLNANARVLAGTSEGGLFRTMDLQHWSRSSFGIKESRIANLETGGLPAVTYAVTGSSLSWTFPGSFLYRKGQGQTTWKSLASQFLKNTSIRSLAVHPLDGNRLLVVPGNDNFGDYFTSFDGGVTWNQGRLAENGNVESAAWDPSNKEVGYLLDTASILRIWKTTDSGETFSKIEVPEIDYPDGARLIFDPHDTESLYLLHRFGMHHSSDGGLTFQKIKSSIDWPVDMVTLPQPSSFLLLTGWGKVFRTTDGGQTWKKLSQIGKFSQHLYSASLSGKRFFATRGVPYGEEINHLLESNDGGNSWKDITSTIDSTGVFDLAIEGHSILAATNHGVRLQRWKPSD